MSGDSISSNIARQERLCLTVIDQAFSHAPKSLQHLKKYSISNLYKYLTFKILAGSLNRQKGLTAARCFWYSVKNNPLLLRQHPKLMLIVSIKIAAAILLTEQQVKALLAKVKKPT